MIPASDKPKPPKPNTFDGNGLRFIDIRPAHIDFIAAVMDREAPDFERMAGYCLVNEDYLPLGFAVVYFEDDDVVSVHGYFGDWLRTYPREILRQISGFFSHLRDNCDVKILHASADESIEGSLKLIQWMRGEDTGLRNELGPIFKIDLTKTKI